MGVTNPESAKETTLDVIQQFLSREMPDFIVQFTQRSGRTLHLTLHRVGDGSSCRVTIAAHFADHHHVPIEIETFLEHHGLVEKLQSAGSRPIVIDNAGVHLGKGK